MDKFPWESKINQEWFDLLRNTTEAGNWKQAEKISIKFSELSRSKAGLETLTREHALATQATCNLQEAILRSDARMAAHFAIGLVLAPKELRTVAVEYISHTIKNMPEDAVKGKLAKIIEELSKDEGEIGSYSEKVTLIVELHEGLAKYPGDKVITKVAREAVHNSIKMSDFVTAKAITELTMANIGTSLEFDVFKKIQEQFGVLDSYKLLAEGGNYKKLCEILNQDFPNLTPEEKVVHEKIVSKYIALLEI